MSRVLITGANRGIGLELARVFAARGDELIAVVRSPSEELRQLEVRIVDGVDITRGADLDRLEAALGGDTLDVFVNNAGVLTRETLEDLDLDRIRHQLEVNALGPLRLCARLCGRLVEGSKVAIITSRMGSVGDNTSGSMYGYRMSKAAVNMAGRSLAHDLRPKGVSVVLLHPGYVKTRMTDFRGNWGPAEAASCLVQRIDELEPEGSGRLIHADGTELPW